ncbi:MAG: MBL fold metallo-hydrolase [Lachnospiraceae bacterium]|nr:MBL fold metallo-hydrolase [Lachnospiraceae bacterium]
MKVTLLGVRGSIPTDGKDHLEFGGATSCVLVQACGQAVYLDGGSGMLHSPDTSEESASVLFTHTHVDHMIGLPISPLLLSKRRVDIYGKTRDGLDIRQQLERLMSLPLWPAGVEVYPSELHFHETEQFMNIGGISVSCMEANHPGGSLIYRLEHEGKSLVYATDHEHSTEKQAELADFAEAADLILYDAQYTDEEYEKMKGFGHSTVAEGLKLLNSSKAKRILFVHHDPRHTDDMLKKSEEGLKDTRAAFARQGMVIRL